MCTCMCVFLYSTNWVQNFLGVFIIFNYVCVCVGVHLSAGAQEEQRDQISMEKVVMSHSLSVLEIELSSKNSMSS